MITTLSPPTSPPPAAATRAPSSASSRPIGAGCTRIATGCSAPPTMPRTRSRRRCCARGGGCRGSRAAARCAPGSTGSPPTSACGRSSGGRRGCSRRLRPGARPALAGGAARGVGLGRAVPGRAARSDGARRRRPATSSARASSSRSSPRSSTCRRASARCCCCATCSASRPAEIAEALDTTPAAVYSALQRAHAAVEANGCPSAASRRRCARSATSGCASWPSATSPRGRRATSPRSSRCWPTTPTFAMPPRRSWYRGRDGDRRVPARAPVRAAGARWRIGAGARQRAARIRATRGWDGCAARGRRRSRSPPPGGSPRSPRSSPASHPELGDCACRDGSGRAPDLTASAEGAMPHGHGSAAAWVCSSRRRRSWPRSTRSSSPPR